MRENFKKRFRDRIKGVYGSKSLFLALILNPLCQNLVKLSLIFLISTGCIGIFRKVPDYPSIRIKGLVSYNELESTRNVKWNLLSKVRDPKSITAIVLHNSGKRKLPELLRLSVENQFMFHIYVDSDGNIYGDPNFLNHEWSTAPGIDLESIHLVYEGTQETLYNNRKQRGVLNQIISYLTDELNIPKSNYDVISKKGVFTHNQTKRRFGGFVDFSPCGSELALKQILSEIDGKFFEEDDWKDRFVTGWVLKKENKEILKETFKPTNGRGITKAEKINIASLEKDEKGFPPEEYRVKYTFRGKIKPSCVVLHYTAISEYFKSLRTLEARNLTASIMVDNNGKAYQLVDVLEDRAAAATGTNDNCIQIEIVAKDTDELFKQPDQIKTVKDLVIQLTTKYKIPLSNEKLEDLTGVFSHTQAKKKWGGSIFLNAKDFDPGEEYMEMILNSVGGKYYSEPEWKNRKSIDWAILFRNFQP
ncbi:N-acetylmuramoyl-L-alanine amidase [Leptospira bourretii]|uniref:peptidoglycan recognition protein family protein n=1 Tax=Leptospira bourretii TaxID=2484962 RepID=UPI001091845B|nr:peptidoglycan recognition family protein [Leptospira bourretii]TGL22724.1 N-acetylmuramoyl-L-alanine amidase [Leptospira bourretii]